VPTEKNEDPLLSRGTFMVLSTITVAVCGTIVLIGTSAPLLTRFMENPGQVGPSFYNQVGLPIALAIAMLLAFVPYLTWKGEDDAGKLARKLLVPGIFALVAAAGAVVWKVHQPFHVLFIFFAALALATNAHKTVLKYKSGGLRGAGGYLAHVGVGVILLGVIASSAYDESTKVTLEMGVPRQVGDAKLTFVKMVPRRGFEKEGMEIAVERGGKSFTVTPRMFMNDRTRQLMVNPDIKNSLLADFYVSPIEFDPGQSSLQLAKGDSGQVGDMTVRFLKFDLDAEGNAMAQMAAGKPVTIGADLEVVRDGQSVPVKPLYRLNAATGQVEPVPAALPGGGQVIVTGIDATSGAVRLEVAGVNLPPRLSVDVTHKPLIQLVWGGLYIVLIGGLMATVSRIRQARMQERIAEGKA
jgi:cytochrome c-type biogenesis protein CcmF